MANKKVAKQQCWSADNETFNCETLGDLLDNHDLLAPGNTVYVADAEPPNVAHLCDADDVIDTIANRASDMAGEYAEDCASVSAIAKAELNSYLARWIKKRCNLNFWTVKNVKEYVLTADDFPDLSVNTSQPAETGNPASLKVEITN